MAKKNLNFSSSEDNDDLVRVDSRAYGMHYPITRGTVTPIERELPIANYGAASATRAQPIFDRSSKYPHFIFGGIPKDPIR